MGSELTGRAGPRVLVSASDERLVALARAGDEQAFAAIVERYRAPLLRYCRGFLPPSAAEDAVQQTFINAYRALSREGAANVPMVLRPWLYRVAHNAALNVARDPQSGFEPLPEGLDGVRRPDEVVQQRERFRRVLGAVSALPPRQRQVIVRSAIGGESHERIASDLGVSAGSIRQLAHRARRTVRDAAAALIPGPVMRLLPWGPEAVEATPGVALAAKVAVVTVVAGAAGGGAVEVAKRDDKPRAVAEARADAPRKAPPRQRARPPVAAPPVAAPARPSRTRRAPARKRSGPGSSRSGSGDSSGRGSSGGGSSGSSGSGSSGSGSSGGGDESSGSVSSGSGSGSSGSGSSGSGSSGSGSDSSGSGSSGSSGSGSDSSGSGSSGSGSSGDTIYLSESSSGSGSSGDDSSGSGSSGSDEDSSGSG
jgi:RNA polymerase sigma factor (sigma-70 family)